MNPLSEADLQAMGVCGLHCGSGATLHRGLLNIDLMQLSDGQGRQSQPGRLLSFAEGVHYLEHDQTTPYPIASAAVGLIFSEHFIEHISVEQAIAWLREVHRLLKPGGVARISTPDLARYANGYVDPDHHFYAQHQRQLQRMGMTACPARPAWMLNQIFRHYGHQWIYDFDELALVASAAGFDRQQIRQCTFRSGAIAELAQLDQEIRSDESLYVELIKQP
jgi:predicted SAM-dependent methyltransferase